MRWSDEVSEAGWIAPRLAAFGSGRVDSVVPGGFDAYARILHPAESSSAGRERMVRWSEVAAWSGAALEPDTQFHDIALPRHQPTAPAPWSQGPREGSLTGADAAALIAILREDTTTPQQCWCCVWDGYGWDNTLVLAAGTDPDAGGGSYHLPDVVPAEVRSGPRVQLPGRDYLLYTGPIEDALAFVPHQEQTPNLWWPDDHAWCVASEIDLPWTYLGGTTDLVRGVLGDDRLEALPADPQDTVQLRVGGWLAERIDTALSQLLADNQTLIETACGTVRASLERPRGTRASWLHTTQETPNGSQAHGRSLLSARTEDDLRSEIHTRVTFAVVGLLDG